jgi:hypothetical protein
MDKLMATWSRILTVLALALACGCGGRPVDLPAEAQQVVGSTPTCGGLGDPCCEKPSEYGVPYQWCNGYRIQCQEFGTVNPDCEECGAAGEPPCIKDADQPTSWCLPPLVPSPGFVKCEYQQ